MSKDKYLSSKDCIFCQIISGKLPANLKYEDEDIIAVDDINPMAPIHVQVITKKHIESLDKVTKKEEKLVGKALYVCKILAKELGIAENGYRVVTNVGKWGGQFIPHLHFHLVGGAPLTQDFAMHAATKADVVTAKKV